MLAFFVATQEETMTNNDLTKNRFLAGPILPPLLQFAFPLMLSQLLQPSTAAWT